jgi:peptidyl-tRNA hydrolase
MTVFSSSRGTGPLSPRRTPDVCGVAQATRRAEAADHARTLEAMPVEPPDEAPWAMQVAARAEKASPPSHRAVCEAAAMAVVRLLADPRAAEGEWRDRVRRWESGPIRKVTRRARGVRWQAVQALPGVTADHAGAQVRAFVPGSTAEVPPELARLQVAGLDLADDQTGGPDDPLAGPYALVALNPDVKMTTGKAAAQSAHAAHLLLRRIDPARRRGWISAGLAVRLARDVRWDECVARAAVTVRDAGFTEVPPGTMTAVSWLVPGRPGA